jgi:hypothetical protein
MRINILQMKFKVSRPAVKKGRDKIWDGPDPEVVLEMHRQLKEGLVSTTDNCDGYRL